MIFYGQWKFFAQYRPELVGYQLAMVVQNGDEQSIVTNIELQRIPRHGFRADEYPIPPDQVENFLQAAMDEAWEIGLRPTGHEDYTNELKAVRYHLEDMRLLAKVRKAD